MFKTTRQAALLEQLNRQGSLSAAEAAEQLGVSEDTIRRDLRELAAHGQLQRVHGGALTRPTLPARHSQRRSIRDTAKTSIATRAAALISPGNVVFLGSGSTALSVAEHLPIDLRATIVTHAPAIANALADHTALSIYLAGGQFDGELGVALGSETTNELASFRADIGFIGVCALDADIGLSIPRVKERAIKRLIISRSARVIALADADKLGHAYPHIVAPADTLTDLVTDEHASDTDLDVYRRFGITIHR